ncbi:MAG: hypothetical protein RMJ88_02340 [Thermogemmata sp.]|nr:hypothetical protein [Thermogemmata sp.]
MENNKGLSLVAAMSLFATLLNMFVGDRILERLYEGDEKTRTIIFYGIMLTLFLITVTLIWVTGLTNISDIVVKLLITWLVASVFFDVATTFIGIYNIILPRSNSEKALLMAMIVTIFVFSMLLTSGTMLKRISNGSMPKFCVYLYVTLLICVICFDFWTSYRGTAVYLWNVADTTQLPNDQWVVLIAIAASISLSTVILGIWLSHVLAPE